MFGCRVAVDVLSLSFLFWIDFPLTWFKQLSRVVNKERLIMLSNTFFVAVFASLVLSACTIPFKLKVLSQDTADSGSLIEGESYQYH